MAWCTGSGLLVAEADGAAGSRSLLALRLHERLNSFDRLCETLRAPSRGDLAAGSPFGAAPLGGSASTDLRLDERNDEVH